MTDERPRRHATANWGSLAKDPWKDPFPSTPAWEEAVRRTFLRDGGTPEQYEETFGARFKTKKIEAAADEGTES